MSKETSLEKYTRLVQKRDSHVEANKAVFDAHQNICFDIIDAENDLRDSVAEANAGVSNIEYTVTCMPQSQEVIDEELVLKGLNLDKKRAIELGYIKVYPRPARISIKKNE